jgi:hypothetical protein
MARQIQSGLAILILTFAVSFCASAKNPENIFEDVSGSVVIVDILDVKGDKIGHGSGGRRLPNNKPKVAWIVRFA